MRLDTLYFRYRGFKSLPSTLSHPTGWDRTNEIKSMLEEQKYCYLVEHPHHGTKIFYYGPVWSAEAARDAVDYAENLCTVFKLPITEMPVKASANLSAQFSAVAKPTVELPSIPVEAMLSSVG